MCIRILDPLELSNSNSRKESMNENERSMNYREAEYLSPDGKGEVTSWIHDVTIEEQHGKPSLDELVTRQRKQTQVCLHSSADRGYLKVVQGYNKMLAMIIYYFMVVTQVLAECTHCIMRKLKFNFGNSGKVSEDEGMWCCSLGSFCLILVSLRKIWRYKHRLWLLLIIDGLWKRDNTFKNKDKGICQQTFRLVVARPWLRNLLLGNVFGNVLAYDQAALWKR